MPINDGSGNGERSERSVKKKETSAAVTTTYDNRGRFSSVVLTFFSWLILLVGFYLSYKYYSDAMSINDMSYTNRERFAELQKLYFIYAWVYPISGVFSFCLLNVINAIYIKLYPGPPKVAYNFKVDSHVG